MKKKILLFEPDELFRNTLLEQISLNKDFEVIEVSDFDDVQCQLEKSSFDLIISIAAFESFVIFTAGCKLFSMSS